MHKHLKTMQIKILFIPLAVAHWGLSSLNIKRFIPYLYSIQVYKQLLNLVKNA